MPNLPEYFVLLGNEDQQYCTVPQSDVLCDESVEVGDEVQFFWTRKYELLGKVCFFSDNFDECVKVAKQLTYDLKERQRERSSHSLTEPVRKSKMAFLETLKSYGKAVNVIKPQFEDKKAAKSTKKSSRSSKSKLKVKLAKQRMASESDSLLKSSDTSKIPSSPTPPEDEEDSCDSSCSSDNSSTETASINKRVKQLATEMAEKMLRQMNQDVPPPTATATSTTTERSLSPIGQTPRHSSPRGHSCEEAGQTLGHRSRDVPSFQATSASKPRDRVVSHVGQTPRRSLHQAYLDEKAKQPLRQRNQDVPPPTAASGFKPGRRSVSPAGRTPGHSPNQAPSYLHNDGSGGKGRHSMDEMDDMDTMDFDDDDLLTEKARSNRFNGRMLRCRGSSPDQPGTVQLLSSGIFCTKGIFDLAEGASNASVAVRRLLQGVFTGEALLSCSLTGMPPRGKGQAAYKENAEMIRPHLCPKSVSAIIAQALHWQKSKYWRPKRDVKALRTAIAVKLCEKRKQ